MGFFRKRKIKKEKEKMTLEQLQQFKQFQKKRIYLRKYLEFRLLVM